jgi:caspase domain-containing protein
VKRALIVLLVCASAPALAGVARYALVVGHNQGHDDEQTLRYAEQDAKRLADVLIDLGGFEPGNVITLRGPTPDAVQGALIGLNDRIRTRGEPAVLVVFYSGHADALALHLGAQALPFERLEQLVRGSAASFRLLIVDACRSGALTRVKGGEPVPAPPLHIAERLPADGLVVWTSSSANEDAQESDELRGSFFTHYLVSGLLGAADANGDGAVTLGEAYTHAYDATLRATSRTLAGLQHATYRHEVHGLADVVLTRLAAPARGLLAFPAGRDYLVMQGGADGAVVADVGARDAERRVSLRPGRYFVRARTPDYLLEGTVDVAAGARTAVDEKALSHVGYARLVRKGAGGRERADRVEAGYTIRSALWSGASACQGAVAGWAADLPAFSLGVRGIACRGGSSNAFLDATDDQLAAELRAVHAWDRGRTSLAIGPLAGAALLSERFATTGTAPARTSLAGIAGVTAAVTVDLADRFYITGELDGITIVFRREEMLEVSTHAASSIRGNVLVGARW